MFRKELQGHQNARIVKRIEEMETQDEDQYKERKDLCLTCLFGSILGLSALAIGYLAFMTAVAYAIP